MNSKKDNILKPLPPRSKNCFFFLVHSALDKYSSFRSALEVLQDSLKSLFRLPNSKLSKLAQEADFLLCLKDKEMSL